MNPLTILRKAPMKELWKLMLFGLRYPAFIFPTLKATKKALQISQQYYGRAHSKNGPANAFRHALWNYLIAQSCTRRTQKMRVALHWTQRITEWHEKLFPNPESDRLMDLHNNAYGRQFFTRSPELEEAELISQLQEAAGRAVQMAKAPSESDEPNYLVYLKKDPR